MSEKRSYTKTDEYGTYTVTDMIGNIQNFFPEGYDPEDPDILRDRMADLESASLNPPSTPRTNQQGTPKTPGAPRKRIVPKRMEEENDIDWSTAFPDIPPLARQAADSLGITFHDTRRGFSAKTGEFCVDCGRAVLYPSFCLCSLPPGYIDGKDDNYLTYKTKE